MLDPDTGKGHSAPRAIPFTGLMCFLSWLSCSNLPERSVSYSHSYNDNVSEYEITKLDDPDPWDRLLQETSEEYLAFVTYRNMGPKRTLAQTSRELGISGGKVSIMKAEHRWDERVVAWDYYQEKIYQAELAEYARQMARTQLEVAQEAMRAVRAPIQALMRKIEANPDLLDEAFEPKDITKLMKLVHDSAKIIPALMNAERLATHQPTEITEHTENRNINYGNTERIGEVLDVLRTTGVLSSILREGETGEIVDAEAVEVDDDPSDIEADSLPPGST